MLQEQEPKGVGLFLERSSNKKVAAYADMETPADDRWIITIGLDAPESGYWPLTDFEKLFQRVG